MKEWLQSEVDAATPYPVATSTDLYNAPPVEYLIDTILPLYSIVGMTGFPGTGKTWLAMEMMRAVATGTKFLGQYDVRKAPVLFIGKDASLLDYATQWRRLTNAAYLEMMEETREIKDEDGTIIRPALHDTNPFDTLVHFLIDSEFNFDDDTQMYRLIRTSLEVIGEPAYEVVTGSEGVSFIDTTKSHFGLIVFDTLSRLTSTEERDNTARGKVFERIRVIATATGATLLVLHHNALPSEFRSGEEFRGGGDQLASLDCHYHLTSKRQGLVEFKTKKKRGITQLPFLLHLDVNQEGPASITYAGPAAEQVKADNQDKLIEDMVKLLKARDDTPMSKRDFTLALFPKYGEQFTADEEKLKKHIENTLQYYVRRSDARIVCAVASTGGRGRPSLYKLSKEEKERANTGSSIANDHSGTAPRGEEASNLAGESPATGSSGD